MVLPSLVVVVVHESLEIAKKTNFNKKLLQIRSKLYHKLGNLLLSIRANVITNRGSFVLSQIGVVSFY